MNRYEYGYMQKLAAINKLATLYNAMKGILRVKEAYGGGSPKLDRGFKREADSLPVEEIVRRLQAHNARKNIPGHPSLLTNAEANYYSQRLSKLAPGKGLESFPNPFVSKPMTPQEKFQMSNPTWKPLQGSPKQLGPALAERIQTVRDAGGLEHIKDLQSNNAAVEQIRRTAGQGLVGGSGMTRQDFIDEAAAANERKNQSQERLQRHKDRVAAAAAAQASGTAEVPPTVNNTADSSASSSAGVSTPPSPPSPPTPPSDNPNKPGFWERHENWAPNMTAMGLGMTAGGAALGGLGGYGAARGLGLYNDDASTAKRMMGHLLTAGGAVGGGILGNYGSNRLAKYLAQRKK